MTLNSPVSHCLELLLNEYPRLVRHSDFFDFVWPDAKDVLLSNALYQNISLLRKGLKTFGDSYGDMVITVPRQGFKLNAKYSVEIIEKKDTDTPSETDNTEPHRPPLPSIEAEKASAERGSGIKGIPVVKNHYLVFFLAFTLCITLGTLIGSYIANNTTYSPPFETEHFKYTSTLGKCTLYLNRKSQWIASQEELERYKINCDTTPYLYLSDYEYSVIKNIFACNAPLTPSSTPACVTYELFNGVEK